MYIDIHTHHPIKTHQCVVSMGISGANNEHQFSIGLHPWLAQEYREASIVNLFKDLIDHQNFFALGEIGVDLSRPESLSLQIQLFRNQIIFATENNISRVIVHCVRALNQVLKIIKDCNYQGILIFHDSNFNQQECERIIKLGYYLSLGRNLFKENSKASKSISLNNLSHYFFETDDSHREIEVVYSHACDLLNVSSDLLLVQIEKNFQQLSTASRKLL